jgi:hypothetical protein
MYTVSGHERSLLVTIGPHVGIFVGFHTALITDDYASHV